MQQNKCTRCHKFFDDPSYKMCQICRAKNRNRWKFREKIPGFCSICNKFFDDSSRKICPSCLDIRRNRRKLRETTPEQKRERADKTAQWRKEKAAEGFCNRCGQHPAKFGRPVCQECFDKRHKGYLVNKQNHIVYARKAKGLCTTCAKPIIREQIYNGKSRATCDDCRSKRRYEKALTRNEKYPGIIARDGGQCQVCGRTSRLCIHHKDGIGESSNGKKNPMNERNNHPDNLITLCVYCHYAITNLRRSSVNRDLAVRLVLF